jgi:phosphatidylinositol 3,5-bisphosphate 5-phosphatase
MHSLQKNITEKNIGQVYETMCVWNEFMTRAIRDHLMNTCWTVALVHGFFKQVYSSAVINLKVLLLVC